MVVDVEVAGEAGAGEAGLVPGAVRLLRVDQPRHAAAHGLGRRAGGEQRQQRPGGLRGGRRAAAAATRVVVGAQVLAPAAVLVLVRLEPGDGRADRGCGAGQPAATSAGTAGAGAVDVVGAPAPEPRAVRLLGGEQPLDAAPGRRSSASGPSRASISTTCAVTSALGGSITSPKSQNGSFAAERAVLSASNAPQPPSATACRASSATRARCGRSTARPGVPRPQRQHHLGGVVDVGVVVVGELERPAARRQPGRRTAQSPGCTISSPSSQSAARASAGWSAGRPASASAITASAVSQTGDWHASSRRPSPSTIVNRSSPASPRCITGWSSG